MDKKNPYEHDSEIRKFIESLNKIDWIGKYIDKDEELVDLLLKDWLKMMCPNERISKSKRNYCIRALKELRRTKINSDWYEYISSMVEWIMLSNKEPKDGHLAIFLFGYCWRELVEKGKPPKKPNS